MMLETDRLVLRPFLGKDRSPFAAINGDSEVMRYFPSPLTRAESDDFIRHIEARRKETGFGFLAVERKHDRRLIGLCGLSKPGFKAHFTPCIEIGWRLELAAWGQGFAYEAARSVLADAFAPGNVDEIVAFTARGNQSSRRLMERLGMRRDPDDDFDHPSLPPDSGLNPCVLYRLNSKEFRA